jgi:hypothetical protein
MLSLSPGAPWSLRRVEHSPLYSTFSFFSLPKNVRAQASSVHWLHALGDPGHGTNDGSLRLAGEDNHSVLLREVTGDFDKSGYF